MIGYGNSMFLATHGILAKGNAGTPPINTVAPVISGSQVVGSTLSTTNGTWTGSPAPTYTYQWYRGATLITGATSSTYTLVQADAGNASNITCQVTGTNTFGNATATSNTLAQILDFDANAFFTASSISDSTIKSATNKLVIDLKAYSLFNKGRAWYPFVGGTSATHKWNLKDPRDLDAAYRLIFNGGWTHSSGGALPNGTNGYADTKLVASGTLALNSTSFGVYSRTNTDLLAPSIGNVTGGASSEASLFLRYSNTSYVRVNGGTASTQANSDSRGLFIANRASSSQILYQIRGTQYTLSNTSNSLNTNSFQLGGVNPNFFDTKELAFAFIADGLTAQNMTDLNTAVVAFQTALSRNV